MAGKSEPDGKATMTRAELAEKLQKEIGLEKGEANDLVEGIFDIFIDCLSDGDSIRIGAFGAFERREKAERMGRNPRTGEMKKIPARKVAAFKASSKLRERISDAVPA